MQLSMAACLALWVLVSSRPANAGDTAPEFIDFPWPVAVAADAPEDVRAVAEDLRGELQTILIEGNAGCCLWIDLGLPPLNPTEPGYIVLIREGGGTILATDSEQLRAAAQRLKEMIVVEEGELKPKLPHGLFTSFPVVE